MVDALHSFEQRQTDAGEGETADEAPRSSSGSRQAADAVRGSRGRQMATGGDDTAVGMLHGGAAGRQSWWRRDDG